jgi:hypothetical protein
MTEDNAFGKHAAAILILISKSYFLSSNFLNLLLSPAPQTQQKSLMTEGSKVCKLAIVSKKEPSFIPLKLS